MKYLKKFESMIHQHTIDQMTRVSNELSKIDIGKRVSDGSFANALGDTKRDVFQTKIQSYEDYMKEPFAVNQNRKPWKERKKKKK